MSRHLPIPAVALVLAVLPACTSAPRPVEQSSVEGVRERVAAIDRSLVSIRQRLLALETRYTEVTLDPTTKAFQRLDTTAGSLLVSCQSVTQYANGYKVVLDVGNPSTATFRGFKMTVSWGPAFDDTTVTDWDTARRDKTVDVTDTLLPGKWNRVSLVLAPAEPRDLSYVTLGIESDIVSLR